MKQKVQKPEVTTEVAPVAAATGKKVPWDGFIGVIFAVAVYFAAQIVAAVLVSLYARAAHGGTDVDTWLHINNVTVQFWYIVAAEALTFGAIWWFVRRRGSSLKAIGLKDVQWRDLAYALVGVVGYFILYFAVLKLVSTFVPSINLDQSQDLGFDNVAGFMPLALTFISLAILPPLVEEIVFRGFIFSGLKNKMPVVWAALFTSLLFASAHLQFGSGKPLLWVAGIDTFTLSLVLCYLRQKTGSLWAGIGVHALKNTLAFITLFLLHLQ